MEDLIKGKLTTNVTANKSVLIKEQFENSLKEFQEFTTKLED